MSDELDSERELHIESTTTNTAGYIGNLIHKPKQSCFSVCGQNDLATT